MSAIITLHNVNVTIKEDSVSLEGLDWRKEDGNIFPNQCSCLSSNDVESDVEELAKRGAEGSVIVAYDEDGESEKWVLKDGTVGVYRSVEVYEVKPYRYLSTQKDSTMAETERLFIMIGKDSDGIPEEKGSVKASSPEEAIEKSLDPNTADMYVPTHMHNQDGYGTRPDNVVRAIALKDSLHYFDLDGVAQKRYTKEYTMLEVDLETGSITEH